MEPTPCGSNSEPLVLLSFFGVMRFQNYAVPRTKNMISFKQHRHYLKNTILIVVSELIRPTVAASGTSPHFPDGLHAKGNTSHHSVCGGVAGERAPKVAVAYNDACV